MTYYLYFNDKVIHKSDAKQNFLISSSYVGTLIAGESVIIRDLHKTMKGDPRGKKPKKKKKDDKSMDYQARSLGGAVSITGRFDSSKPVKKFFKDFKKKSPEVSMAEATNLYIQNILNSTDLKGTLKTF